MGGAVSAGKDNDELTENLKEAGYIKTPQVEQAFRDVDRSNYFPEGSEEHAYKDLAWKQKNVHLSAPCIYSEVMESLEMGEGMSFLNLGSGTGYLSTMVGLIIGPTGINHGVELFEDVVDFANEKLRKFMECNQAFKGINFCEPVFVAGDCLCMDALFRQYDRVYCGAACPPEHEEYMKSLVKVRGILVMPFKDKLCKLKRISEQEWETENVLSVSFAPLLSTEMASKDFPALIQIVSNPRPLQDICRLIILGHLGVKRLSRVTELPLPQSMLTYLCYFRDSRLG